MGVRAPSCAGVTLIQQTLETSGEHEYVMRYMTRVDMDKKVEAELEQKIKKARQEQ
jgi:hypothetical protein